VGVDPAAFSRYAYSGSLSDKRTAANSAVSISAKGSGGLGLTQGTFKGALQRLSKRIKGFIRQAHHRQLCSECIGYGGEGRGRVYEQACPSFNVEKLNG